MAHKLDHLYFVSNRTCWTGIDRTYSKVVGNSECSNEQFGEALADVDSPPPQQILATVDRGEQAGEKGHRRLPGGTRRVVAGGGDARYGQGQPQQADAGRRRGGRGGVLRRRVCQSVVEAVQRIRRLVSWRPGLARAATTTRAPPRVPCWPTWPAGTAATSLICTTPSSTSGLYDPSASV
uniref:Uncharacterized protein n=1 Tax=Aegilops tauschii subsp. strangulata TaxID=200361 RepID=A0A452ZTT8_AEGTS